MPCGIRFVFEIDSESIPSSYFAENVQISLRGRFSRNQSSMYSGEMRLVNKTGESHEPIMLLI